MKIIAVDNFDREIRSDRVIAENVPVFYAETIVQALNGKFGGEQAQDFFQSCSR